MLRLSNAILLVSSTLIARMLLRQVIMAYALGDERGKEEVMEILANDETERRRMAAKMRAKEEKEEHKMRKKTVE